MSQIIFSEGGVTLYMPLAGWAYDVIEFGQSFKNLFEFY